MPTWTRCGITRSTERWFGTLARRSWQLAQASLIWLSTGVLVTAPSWLVMGIGGLVLGLFGPLGVLAFKPGENVAGKLAVAALLASPALLGAAVLARKWSRLGPWGRGLWIVGLSLLWHAPGAIVWGLILRGLN